MVLPMAEDFAHWERRSRGEALIVMLSGSYDLIVQFDGGETRIRLDAGRAVLAPSGVWRRAEIVEPGEALDAAAGEDAEHKPI